MITVIVMCHLTNIVFVYKMISDILAPNLVSNLTNLTVPLCPNTIVQLTCTTVNTISHKWYEGAQEFASYVYSEGDELMSTLPPTYNDLSASGIDINVTSVAQLTSDLDRLNATSVLTASLSALVKLNRSVQCGDAIRLSTPITLTDIIILSKLSLEINFSH